MAFALCTFRAISCLINFKIRTLHKLFSFPPWMEIACQTGSVIFELLLLFAKCSFSLSWSGRPVSPIYSILLFLHFLYFRRYAAPYFLSWFSVSSVFSLFWIDRCMMFFYFFWTMNYFKIDVLFSQCFYYSLCYFFALIW